MDSGAGALLVGGDLAVRCKIIGFNFVLFIAEKQPFDKTIIFNKTSLIMPLKKIYPLLFLLLLCFQCDEDLEECSAVLCAGPPSIALRVLENGGNVFANETYTLEDIIITGENASEIALSIFENQDGTPILVLDNFVWNIGKNNYTITFSGEASADLSIDIILSENDGCCGGIEQLRNFSSNGRVTELNNGSYSVSLR